MCLITIIHAIHITYNGSIFFVLSVPSKTKTITSFLGCYQMVCNLTVLNGNENKIAAVLKRTE